MRVIVKHPNNPPEIRTLGEPARHPSDNCDRQIQQLVGGNYEACLRDGDVRVWCDEEYLYRENPQINFRRPADGHPVCGTVVVTSSQPGRDGYENASLTDEQCARWMYLLVLISPPWTTSDSEPPLTAIVRRQRMLDELAMNLSSADHSAAATLREQLSTFADDDITRGHP